MSLRHVLLTVLSKRPNSGYGIGRLLQRELSHIWNARLQQIYGELARLEVDGLMDVESIDLPNRPAKKIYSLTADGKAELDRWLTDRPASHTNKDDLLVRLYCMERIPPDVLVRRLEEERDAHEAEARELRNRLAQASRTDPSQLGMLVTLEAARSRAESQAAWCVKTLAWLRGQPQAAGSPALSARGVRLRAETESSARGARLRAAGE